MNSAVARRNGIRREGEGIVTMPENTWGVAHIRNTDTQYVQTVILAS